MRQSLELLVTVLVVDGVVVLGRAGSRSAHLLSDLPPLVGMVRVLGGMARLEDGVVQVATVPGVAGEVHGVRKPVVFLVVMELGLLGLLDGVLSHR